MYFSSTKIFQEIIENVTKHHDKDRTQGVPVISNLTILADNCTFISIVLNNPCICFSNQHTLVETTDNP